MLSQLLEAVFYERHKLQAKHQGAAWNSAWKMTDFSPNFRLNIRRRLEFRLICGKTCGGAVHFAVQNGIFGPNMRQNMRLCRSFRRTLVRSTMKNGVIFRSGGKLGQICLIMLEKGTFRRLFNRANRASLTNRAHLKMTWKKSLTNFQEITKNLLR